MDVKVFLFLSNSSPCKVCIHDHEHYALPNLKIYSEWISDIYFLLWQKNFMLCSSSLRLFDGDSSDFMMNENPQRSLLLHICAVCNGWPTFKFTGEFPLFSFFFFSHFILPVLHVSKLSVCSSFVRFEVFCFCSLCCQVWFVLKLYTFLFSH